LKDLLHYCFFELFYINHLGVLVLSYAKVNR
jgi:hypothetical protein